MCILSSIPCVSHHICGRKNITRSNTKSADDQCCHCQKYGLKWRPLYHQPLTYTLDHMNPSDRHKVLGDWLLRWWWWRLFGAHFSNKRNGYLHRFAKRSAPTRRQKIVCACDSWIGNKKPLIANDMMIFRAQNLISYPIARISSSFCLCCMHSSTILNYNTRRRFTCRFMCTTKRVPAICGEIMLRFSVCDSHQALEDEPHTLASLGWHMHLSSSFPYSMYKERHIHFERTAAATTAAKAATMNGSHCMLSALH